MEGTVKLEVPEDLGLPPPDSPPPAASPEPCIDASQFWALQSHEEDPLHTAEFRIVRIDELLPAREQSARDSGDDVVSIKCEAEDDWEMELGSPYQSASDAAADALSDEEDALSDEEDALSDEEPRTLTPSVYKTPPDNPGVHKTHPANPGVHKTLPTTPCTVLLDRGEVLKFFCAHTQTFRYFGGQPDDARSAAWARRHHKTASCSQRAYDHVTSSPEPPRSATFSPVEYLTDSDDDDLEHRLRTYLINKLDTAPPGSDTDSVTEIAHGDALDPTTCQIVYMCTHCTQLFETEASLSDHVAISHSIPRSTTQNMCPDVKLESSIVKGEFPCRLCDRVFQYEPSLQVHVKVYHCNAGNVSHVRYQCKTCRKIFQHAHNLQRHVKNHHAVAQVENSDITISLQGRLTCKHCNQKFKYPQNLLEHVISAHKFNRKVTPVQNTTVQVTPGQNTTVQVTPVQKSSVNVSSVRQKRTRSRNTGGIAVKRTLGCRYCGKVFTYAPHLLEHVLLSHKLMSDVAKVCPVCDRVCQTRARLRTHVNTHIDRTTCPICYKTCARRRQLHSHMRAKHNKKCKFCLKVFRNSQFLQKHLATHGVKRRRHGHCKLCNKDFCRYDAYKSHRLVMHPDLPTLTCDMCNKGNFIDKASLREHMIVVHLKNYYSCQVCNASFTKVAMFKRHKNVAHFNIKCKIVGNIIVSCDDEFQSVPGENNLRVFKCSKCPYDTVKKIYLKRHLVKKHNMEYEFSCCYCNRSFVSDSLLRKHKKHPDPTCVEQKKLFVARLKSARPFVCPVCNMTYKSANSLHVHCKQKHPDMTTLTCNFCNNNDFVHKKYLRCHIIREHLTNVYMCTLCNTSHVDKTRLVRHLQSKVHRLDHCTIHKRKIIKCGPNEAQNTQTNIKQEDDVLSSDNDNDDFNYASVEDSVNDVIDNPGLLEDGEICGEFDLISHLENGDNAAGNCDVKPCDVDMYKCSLCNVYFSRRSKLKCHVSSVHGAQDSDVDCKPSTISCKYCEKEFSSEHTLQMHVKCHGTSDLECSVCGARCKDARALAQHVGIHNHVYKCRFCSYQASKVSALRTHHGSKHHAKTGHLRCHFCGSKAFLDQGDLENHVSAKHTKSSYHCTICDSFFSRKDKLVDHKTKIHFNFKCHIANNALVNSSSHKFEYKTKNCNQIGRYRCAQCAFHAVKANVLKKHLAEKHNYQFKFTCRVCNLVMGSRSALQIHKKRHEDQLPGPSDEEFDGVLDKFDADSDAESGKLDQKSDKPGKTSGDEPASCKFCSKTFKTKSELFLHTKNHLKSQNLVKDAEARVGKRKFECKVCYANYADVKALDAHFRRHRTPFRCNMCGVGFKDLRGLGRHNDAIHLDIPRLTCHLCGSRECTDKSSMRAHMRRAHLIRYSCQICAATFTNHRRLEVHRTHVHFNFETKVINNQLTDCGKTDVDHSRIITNTNYQFRCHICPFACTGLISLKQHLLKKHGEGSEFLCKICKIPQTSQLNLELHLSIHQEMSKLSREMEEEHTWSTTAFPCQYCAFRAASEAKLSKHVRSHSVVEPYECIFCQAAYKTKDKLRRHYIRLHHEATRNNKFHCHFCNRLNFIDKNDIENHVISKHIPSSYRCKICRIAFLKKRDYRKHTNTPHFGVQNKPKRNAVKINPSNVNLFTIQCHKYLLTCSLCDSKFQNKNQLNVHRKTCSNNFEDSLLQCKICNKLFTTAKTFKNHFPIEHDFKYKLTCNFCMKEVTSSLSFKLHVVNKHLKEIYEKTSSFHVPFSQYATVDDEEMGRDIMKNHVTFVSYSDNRSLLKNNVFTCGVCSKVCDNLYGLLSHKRVHLTSQRFNCFACNRAFKDHKDLKRHLQQKHEFFKSNSCKYCKEKFYFKSSLKDHVSLQHCDEIHNPSTVNDEVIVENESFFCLLCNMACENEESYALHCSSHDVSSQDELFTCHECKTTFTSKSEMTRHIHTEHSNVKSECIQVCTICNKSFPTTYLLRRHVNSVHCRNTNTCPFCERVYANVTSHVNKMHLDTTEYQCKYCPRKLVGFTNLRDHENIEHTEEKYKITCNICNLNVATRKLLKVHLKVEHKYFKQFLCHICGDDFDAASGLNAHLRNKHAEKKPEIKATIKCPKCDAVFKSTNFLNTHLTKVHIKQRFRCNVCRKKYTSVTMLRKHKFLIHKIGLFVKDDFKVGDFECPSCFRRYKTETMLLYHYNRDHLPCRCALCHRELQGKHSMEKHLEYSHGMKEKVYPCQICGYVAVTKGRLHKHNLVNHDKNRVVGRKGRRKTVN